MPAQKTTLKEFESIYPKLEEAILDHARSYKLPQAELDWFKAVSKNDSSIRRVHHLQSSY